MTKEFAARRLDVKNFAEQGAVISGQAPVEQHTRLMAETQGRGAQAPVRWSASGEIRNARHVQPEIWLHLKADATLSLTCQRCLAPVDVPVRVERSFRFVPDEEIAAAQDEQAEEDVLALSRSFDLVELVEDELLMEIPLAPRHETCPPVKLALADAGFDNSPEPRENPFAFLGRLRTGKQ
jgi:Predicted metal-binding, possibly nucleic acid-binding protein